MSPIDVEVLAALEEGPASMRELVRRTKRAKSTVWRAVGRLGSRRAIRCVEIRDGSNGSLEQVYELVPQPVEP